MYLERNKSERRMYQEKEREARQTNNLSRKQSEESSSGYRVDREASVLDPGGTNCLWCGDAGGSALVELTQSLGGTLRSQQVHLLVWRWGWQCWSRGWLHWSLVISTLIWTQIVGQSSPQLLEVCSLHTCSWWLDWWWGWCGVILLYLLHFTWILVWRGLLGDCGDSVLLSTKDPDSHGDTSPPHYDWHVLLVHNAGSPVLQWHPPLIRGRHDNNWWLCRVQSNTDKSGLSWRLREMTERREQKRENKKFEKKISTSYI